MAIQIIREATTDVIKRGATRSIFAKQNDLNSRFLNVRIQADGTDIKVDSTSTVILNVERPDKQENMFYGTVNEDGTVRVPLTSWMLELEGTLLCDVSIIAEGEDVAKLTTMQFSIYVEAAVCCDESFVETEEYSVIVDLLNRTTAAEEIAANAAQSAEVLKNACEGATAAANTAADSANNAANDARAVRAGVEAGGFIESLKELNKGKLFSFWVGTQEEYEAQKDSISGSTFCVITDDTTTAELLKRIAQNEKDLTELKSKKVDLLADNITLDEIKACDYFVAHIISQTNMWDEVTQGDYTMVFTSVQREDKAVYAYFEDGSDYGVGLRCDAYSGDLFISIVATLREGEQGELVSYYTLEADKIYGIKL